MKNVIKYFFLLCMFFFFACKERKVEANSVQRNFVDTIGYKSYTGHAFIFLKAVILANGKREYINDISIVPILEEDSNKFKILEPENTIRGMELITSLPRKYWTELINDTCKEYFPENCHTAPLLFSRVFISYEDFTEIENIYLDQVKRGVPDSCRYRYLTGVTGKVLKFHLYKTCK